MKKIYTLVIILIAFMLSSAIFIEEYLLAYENSSNEQIENGTFKQSKQLYQRGRILIKLKEGRGDYDLINGPVFTGIKSLDHKMAKFQVEKMDKRFKFKKSNMRDGVPDLSRIYVVNFPDSYCVITVAEAFSKDPNIEYAEPEPIYYLDEIPNDEKYENQHYLPQIMASEAWDYHHGEDGAEVVVCINDSGADWDHPDLLNNIWHNLGEDADNDGTVLEFIDGEWVFDPGDENGIDDDGNGYVDDFIGWDFHFNDNNPDPINDGFSHGTGCAGLASAVTNNEVGIAGIAWNVKLLPLQVSDENEGIVYPMDGLIYAAENGIDIISNSYRTGIFSQGHLEAIQYVQSLGCILVASAGNDNNMEPHYPSGYPGVIAVAAVKNDDVKATFSSYGPAVDVSAPGVNMISTVCGGNWSYWSGTSMSSPITAGLIALLKSYHPDWNNDQLVMQVLGTADNVDEQNPNYIDRLGTGRINAYRTLTESNPEVEQKLRMEILGLRVEDENGNTILEPGENVTLGVKIQNYAFGVSDDNLRVTLSCESDAVELIDTLCTTSIPADAIVLVEDAFQIKVSEEASTNQIELKITLKSNLEITDGDEATFPIVLAPSGILIFNGDGTGSAYSGEYIKSYLDSLINTHGMEYEYYYTSQFPSSLNGFDMAFMSFGNYGQTLQYGTLVTYDMSQIINNYLKEEGKLYVDCGSYFGIQDYYEYDNLQESMQLFGIEEIETPMTSNGISGLFGLENSCADGMAFNSTSQYPLWYIDKLTPNDNGVALFEEENYGVVAVQQFEGDSGQRTILLNYALGELDDDTLGTKDQLMEEILKFFGYYYVDVEENEIFQNQEVSVTIYPNPTSNQMWVRYTIFDTRYSIPDINLTITDIQGKVLFAKNDLPASFGEHEIAFDLSGFGSGLYFCVLQIGDEIILKKVIKH